MTVKEIVEKHLKENGYDGLYDPNDPCGCPIDALFLCDNPGCIDCEPGYKCRMDEDEWGPDKWGFGPNKEKV